MGEGRCHVRQRRGRLLWLDQRQCRVLLQLLMLLLLLVMLSVLWWVHLMSKEVGIVVLGVVAAEVELFPVVRMLLVLCVL